MLPAICASAVSLAAKPTAAAAPKKSAVAVVYARESADAASRGFSKLAGESLARRMGEAGVEARLYPEGDIKIALAEPTKVAHFVNFDSIQGASIAAIRVYAKRGGKMIVYNSNAGPLADLMRVRTFGYAASRSEDPWSGFSFDGAPPLYAPVRIRGAPGGIRRAAPLDGGGSRTIARWDCRSGASSTNAAVIKCEGGYWLTGILTDDGNSGSRARLAVALSGALHAPVWREAYTRLWTRMGEQVGAKDLSGAPAALRRKAAKSRVKPPEGIARIEQSIAAIGADREKGLLAAGTSKMWDLTMPLASAYAAAEKKWPGAIRAVWDPSGRGLYYGEKDNYERTFKTLRHYGVTDVFILVATPTTTSATIPGLEPTRVRKASGDVLAKAIEEGRRNNIRVHAWICAMGLKYTADDYRLAQKSGELMAARLKDSSGKPVDWLDPGSAAAVRRLNDTVSYIATNYGVDGVHLDYIRYRDFFAGMDGDIRAKFERSTGAKVKNWPKDVSLDGRQFKQFAAFKASRVQSTVESAYRICKAANPNIAFSTAVYGYYPMCIDSVGQDWKAWLEAGIVDYVVPMNYAGNEEIYRKCMAAPSKFPAGMRRKVISGLGVTASESNLSPFEVIDQIGMTRDCGLAGVSYFDLDHKLSTEILPVVAPIFRQE